MTLVDVHCCIRSRISFLLSGQADGNTKQAVCIFACSKRYDYPPVLEPEAVML